MMDVSLALLPGSRGKPKLSLDKHIRNHKQHAHRHSSTSVINLYAHLSLSGFFKTSIVDPDFSV